MFHLSRSLKLITTNMDQSATYDFLLVINGNHGPMSYRFRDKRQKLKKISHPVYLTPPLSEFHWNFVTAVGL